MCWSASVSLNTFIFTLFATWFAYFNRVIGLPNVLFVFTYSSMQLVEYFVWSNTFPNKRISQFALFIIMIQPIMSAFDMPKLHYILIFLGLYTLFAISIFAFFKPWNTIDFRMIPSKQSKHLSWLWLDFPWYITITWILFLIFPTFVNREWLKFFFMIAAISYSYVMFAHDKTWGSIWCWIGNTIAFVYIYKVFMKDICIM